MKIATITKTGYTAGTYGCTNEFFSVSLINGSVNTSFVLKGMYGAEQRVAQAIETRGYDVIYPATLYGKMKSNDPGNRFAKTENQAIEKIDTFCIEHE